MKKFLIFILVYIAAMLMALVLLWIVNILEHIGSLTIGSLIYSLISNYANWFQLTIISFITMFIYIGVPMFPMIFVDKADFIWGRKKIILLIGITLFILLDPAVKFYLPSSWFDFISHLQYFYHIVDSHQLAANLTDSSVEHSRYDFIAVDVYILISTILLYLKKD